jgi:hypothetical protein
VGGIKVAWVQELNHATLISITSNVNRFISDDVLIPQ